MQSGAGEVPEAVLFEILIRLPVKSLCRFRSVCTCWLSVISDPYFIRSHYALSETRPKRKLLLMDSRSRSMWEMLVSDEDHPEPVATVKLLKRSAEIDHLPSRSVHGLICFPVPYTYNGIRITNPITQEYISIFPPTGIGRKYGAYDCHKYCFGFDPNADKHKVLYSFAAFDYPTQSSAKVIEHWVLTLGSTEKWRRVGALYNNFHPESDFNGDVCINGVIYFRSFDHLVAFDLESENFQTVKLSLPGTRPLWSYKVIEFNGSVALACNCLADKGRYRHPVGIHLLVLEDFHKQVWKLERSVAPPDLWFDICNRDQPMYIACAPCSGNLLVFKPQKRPREPGLSFSLYFYDVRSNRFWSSKIRTPEGDAFAPRYYANVCDHLESVVPPKGSSDRL